MTTNLATEVLPYSQVDPCPRPDSRLFTLSWEAFFAGDRSDVLAPVRISRGAPRWLSRAVVANLPRVPELMPLNLGVARTDWEEFETAYFAQLDEFGVDYIAHKLAVLHRRAGLPLALLCFEATRGNCHRGLFAKWWEYETGEAVPEWAPYDHPQTEQQVQSPLF